MIATVIFVGYARSYKTVIAGVIHFHQHSHRKKSSEKDSERRCD